MPGYAVGQALSQRGSRYYGDTPDICQRAAEQRLPTKSPRQVLEDIEYGFTLSGRRALLLADGRATCVGALALSGARSAIYSANIPHAC